MRRVLAVVGSVRFVDDPRVEAIILDAIHRIRPDEMTSGEADGVDTSCRKMAEREGIPFTGFPPARRRWDGPGGFRERNQQIADACTHLVRIAWSGSKTYGSGWTRDRAQEQGKHVEEFVLDLLTPAEMANLLEATQ